MNLGSSRFQNNSTSLRNLPLESTTLIELYISCDDLRREDLFSFSDPFAVLYVLPVDGRKWIEYGRTETIDDTQNPRFTQPFVLEYTFSDIQQLKIEVYDRDSPSDDLNRHDFQGQIEFHLGRVIGLSGQSLTLSLENKRTPGLLRSHNYGTITIRAEEVSSCKDIVNIQFSAKNLDRKNCFFGKSDPFLNISRSREDGSWVRVWSSEVIKNNLNPTWKSVTLSIQKICNGDIHRPLKIDCMDWERSGTHKLIGSVETTMDELTKGIEQSLSLINPEIQRKKGKKYNHSGILLIPKIQISKRYSFLDYLRGGCEINLIVGIDYTASNGVPTNPQSLHHCNPCVFNQYQQAIQATGEILEEYDSDHYFPLYGFGGKVNGMVNHCFPLTWDDEHPEVLGVKGILEAYANSFEIVFLSGPTLFAPIINKAIQFASQYVTQQNQKYFVLLMITDGVIMDMKNTIDAIVYASHFPLSIVIVGVGKEDFTEIEILDGDDQILKSSKGEPAARDIVQFVPFLKYRDNPFLLRQEILAEIPSQLMDYMASRHFVPNTFIPAANAKPVGSVPSYDEDDSQNTNGVIAVPLMYTTDVFSQQIPTGHSFNPSGYQSLNSSGYQTSIPSGYQTSIPSDFQSLNPSLSSKNIYPSSPR